RTGWRARAMSLTLALPSKGRLKEHASAIVEKAGLPIAQSGDERSYRARIEGRDDVEVKLLSASEIAAELGAGTLDLDITGEDLLLETLAAFAGKVEITARLPFGFADVVVAVPDSWWDVDTMTDLNDVAADFRQRHGRRLRIATKY